MAINKTLLTVSRAVHIYLTMLGLLVMLLFGVTGFTINREEWFGAATPRVSESATEVPPALIAQHDALRIVELLRRTFQIHGAVANYDEVENEIGIAFKEPGQIWEISIDKTTGHAAAHHEVYNFAALINNLHRGRYTGAAWSWVIDGSAALIVLACLTGFVLWLALPRRRRLGIAFLVLGTLGTMGVIYFLVPGPDVQPTVHRDAPAASGEVRRSR